MLVQEEDRAKAVRGETGFGKMTQGMVLGLESNMRVLSLAIVI